MRALGYQPQAIYNIQINLNRNLETLGKLFPTIKLILCGLPGNNGHIGYSYLFGLSQQAGVPLKYFEQYIYILSSTSIF